MTVRILVVDDESDIEMLFKQQFRRELREGRFVLDFAASGDEALAKMKANGAGSLILLVSDINMPGMSGLELLRHIREEFENLSPEVFMITAYGDSENYQRAIGLGATDLLTKPLDFTLLRQKLQLQD